MSIGLIVAIFVVVALVTGALFLALPRIRGGSERRLSRPRRPVEAERPRDEQPRDDRRGSREERALIAEGEAIREQVETRLARERRTRSVRLDPTPLAERDELARQLARDPRERYSEADPPSGYAETAPIGNGRRPEVVPASAAVELELQEIAADSRGRTAASASRRPILGKRRRVGYDRPERADELDARDERLAPRDEHLAPRDERRAPRDERLAP